MPDWLSSGALGGLTSDVAVELAACTCLLNQPQTCLLGRHMIQPTTLSLSYLRPPRPGEGFGGETRLLVNELKLVLWPQKEPKRTEQELAGA